ncbi:MAG: response regulator [Myxococcales bacterium]|nr:response regulator [Myxococcales bacterium]
MSRVLLIEDNPANRRLLGDHLRRVGYEVIEAEDADSGLAIAFNDPVDLVVMDIQLPGTDGLTATRLLRANATTKAIPIIAVTAHAMRGDEARILEAGCNAYTSKPIDYREFLKQVAALIDPA